jgi:hypothetical protein
MGIFISLVVWPLNEGTRFEGVVFKETLKKREEKISVW